MSFHQEEQLRIPNAEDQDMKKEAIVRIFHPIIPMKPFEFDFC